jgi:hypothetical protein
MVEHDAGGPGMSESALDFPAGLAKPALRALHAAGYTSLDQLVTVTEADVRRLHGMGPKAIESLRAALEARGKSFAGARSG